MFGFEPEHAGWKEIENWLDWAREVAQDLNAEQLRRLARTIDDAAEGVRYGDLPLDDAPAVVLSLLAAACQVSQAKQAGVLSEAVINCAIHYIGVCGIEKLLARHLPDWRLNACASRSCIHILYSPQIPKTTRPFQAFPKVHGLNLFQN